ncbi:nuclear transport factor 2 family protein [Leptolyngbya sp. FACHB-36]|nr:nuclear transport factor 2 family protein [Leptolyngbya sp. FACHB-36]
MTHLIAPWSAKGLKHPNRGRRSWQTSLFAVGLALASALSATIVQAETPETAPADLKQALSQIDAAANSRNLQGVLQFYSPNFSHSDGLTRQSLEQSLSKLWSRYPTLNYRTELKSWKPDGSGISAETVTYITGSYKQGNREFKLNSTLAATQRFENRAIVRQEVVSERSETKSGSNPPTLKLTLPEQVNANEEFSIDAVVQEPLGDSLLLGAALEESIKPEGYLNPTTVNLELLAAGGIFKVGRAPTAPDNRWISAVVVRQDGMTMVTQRLRVVGKPAK